MKVYINSGSCANLVVDGRPVHIKAGETIHCEQEINNPYFHKITPEQEVENAKMVEVGKAQRKAVKKLTNKKESKNNE